MNSLLVSDFQRSVWSVPSILVAVLGQTHKEGVPRFASVVKWWISIWSDLNFWHLKWIWQNHKKACGILARYTLTYRASLISFAFNVKRAWIQNFRCFAMEPKSFWTCSWLNFVLHWFNSESFDLCKTETYNLHIGQAWFLLHLM